MTENLEPILRSAKTIAVVGLSSSVWRPSYGVSEYMQAVGYRIIPVNPKEASVLGEQAYGLLDEIPVPVDIVNVFRAPRFVPEVAEAAIRIGAKCLWLQEGVVCEEGSRRSTQHQRNQQLPKFLFQPAG